jgi:hypothetical protein
MAPEIPLDRQRSAQYVYSEQVEMKLSEIRAAEAQGQTARTRPASVAAE